MSLDTHNFQEKLKKAIFDALHEIQEKSAITITKAGRIAKDVGIEPNIGNISRAAMSKLMLDIVPQFKNAGLEFYSDSIVSRAIYEQLIEYAEQGHELLKKYYETLNCVGNDNLKSNQDTQLVQTNSFVRFCAKLRKFLKRPHQQKSSITSENIEEAKLYISKYQGLEQQVCSYNIRDNIIPAITHILCPKDDFIYLSTKVPALMDEDIAPVLEKLGLGDLIPQLEEQLVAEYTNNANGALEQCTSQSEMDLYVPNFEKYRAQKKTKEATNAAQLHMDEETQILLEQVEALIAGFEQDEK